MPVSPSVGNKHQVLSMVSAEDYVIQPAELGLTMDNNLVIDQDPACYTPYNSVLGYYEWFDYAGGNVTRCRSLGVSTTGHLYSIAQQSNLKYQFFVDGVAQLASPLVEMRGTHQPNAEAVRAGGEVVWDTSVSGPEPVNWGANFAGAGNTQWQRFNNTLGWVTIASNNAICNGAQNVCTGGAWSFATGSFPTTWSVSH
jgi:hypothetical protein